MVKAEELRLGSKLVALANLSDFILLMVAPPRGSARGGEIEYNLVALKHNGKSLRRNVYLAKALHAFFTFGLFG